MKPSLTRIRKKPAEDGKICDTQCSYVLGLEYGIITDIQSAGEHLARKVKDKDYTVGTGFFGTGLLNPALTHVGKTSEAYKLLLQTNCPSWLYPVTQGATSIWEHWDSYTKEKGFGRAEFHELLQPLLFGKRIILDVPRNTWNTKR